MSLSSDYEIKPNSDIIYSLNVYLVFFHEIEHIDTKLCLLSLFAVFDRIITIIFTNITKAEIKLLGKIIYKFLFSEFMEITRIVYATLVKIFEQIISTAGNKCVNITANHCLEKHLSMFKNNDYSEYFFGDAPNRRSLGFDLLERESNLVFFDELDKCPEHFFSAFYTLFDNTQFKDATYDADVSGIVIVLTSNYQTEEEMKKQLGLPIFYRIDKLIHFDDFSCDTIYKIVQNEILARKDEYDTKLTPEMVYAAVSPLISTSGENARTIKYKVQQVIEELLFQEVLEKMTV